MILKQCGSEPVWVESRMDLKQYGSETVWFYSGGALLD